MYRVTVTVWRTGAAEHLPAPTAGGRSPHATPTPTVDDDPVVQLAGAAQMLGPLVDVDRLRGAQPSPAGGTRPTGPPQRHRRRRRLPAQLADRWPSDRRRRRARPDRPDGPASHEAAPKARPWPHRGPTVGRYVCDECGYDGRTSRGLGSHRLTHRNVDCDCGWAGTAAEHRAHIRWHCPNRTGGAA